RSAPGLARQVIHSGGAVLLATDTRLTLRRGMWDVVEITGNPVQGGDEKLVHRNFPDCPYAVPVEPGAFADQPGPVWDLFGGREPLRRVATNTPSYLVVNFRRG